MLFHLSCRRLYPHLVIATDSVTGCAGVQLVFFFLYGNMQVAFAFLLSCFFRSTSVANISTWIWVLGAGLFAGNFLDSVFIDDKWWSLPLQFIPTFGGFRSGPTCTLRPSSLAAELKGDSTSIRCSCMQGAVGAGAVLDPCNVHEHRGNDVRGYQPRWYGHGLRLAHLRYRVGGVPGAGLVP